MVSRLAGRPDALFRIVAERQSPASVAEAIAAGAQINMRDSRRRTALHYACEFGDVALALALMDVPSASINVQDEAGKTPLHLATQGNFVEIGTALIKRGATLDAVDTAGETPLHRAAAMDHVHMMAVLVESGARMDIRNKDGMLATDSHPGLKEIPGWLISTYVNAIMNEPSSSPEFALKVRKLRQICVNDELHGMIIQKVFQDPEVRERIATILRDDTGGGGELILSVIEYIYVGGHAREQLMRANVVKLLGDALVTSNQATQTRILRSLTIIAENAGGDMWRRCFTVSSAGLLNVISMGSLNSSNMIEALLLIVRASRFAACQHEMVENSFVPVLLDLAKDATIQHMWDTAYGALQTISNLCENVETHEHILQFAAWDCLVVPFGICDRPEVRDAVPTSSIPPEIRFEALRSLILLGMEDRVYFAEPRMFHLFDDKVYPLFEDLVYENEVPASPMSPIPSGRDLIDLPTDFEPLFLHLPSALGAWWGTPQAQRAASPSSPTADSRPQSMYIGAGSVPGGGVPRTASGNSGTLQQQLTPLRPGIPRSGSLLPLVRYLATASGESQYAEQFFFAYHTFTSPVVLVRLLIHLASSRITTSSGLPALSMSLVLLEMFIKEWRNDLDQQVLDMIRRFIQQRLLHTGPSMLDRTLGAVITDIIENPSALSINGSGSNHVRVCDHDRLYLKARDAILQGSLPLKVDEAAKAAAMQLRIETFHEPPFADDAAVVARVESMYKRLLPLDYQNSKGIVRKVAAAYLGVRHLTERDCKHVYINTVRHLPTYGYVFFHAMMTVGPSNSLKHLRPCKFGIGLDGVLVLDSETAYVVHNWPYNIIYTWGAARRTVLVRVNTGGGLLTEYGFVSKLTPQIVDTMKRFTELRERGATVNEVFTDLTVDDRCQSAPDVLLGNLVFYSDHSLRVKPFTPMELLEYPEEVARQMALLHQRLFNAITRRDCLNYIWTSDKAPASIQQNIDHFNRLSHWVSSEVVLAMSEDTRVRILQQMIQVAYYCRKYNNFNGLMAVLAGLNSSPVRKLKATWASLPRESLATFNELEMLMDSSHNFARYRQALAEATPPLIAFMGVTMSDLQFVVDGNNNYTSTGQINFSKRARFWMILSDLERSKQPHYYLRELPDITEFLSEVTPMSDDAQFEIARQISSDELPRRSRAYTSNRSSTLFRTLGQRSRRAMSAVFDRPPAKADAFA